MIRTTLAPTQVSTGTSYRGATRGHGDAFAATLAQYSGKGSNQRPDGGGTRVSEAGPVPTWRDGVERSFDGARTGRPAGSRTSDAGENGTPSAGTDETSAPPAAHGPGPADGPGAVPGAESGTGGATAGAGATPEALDAGVDSDAQVSGAGTGSTAPAAGTGAEALTGGAVPGSAVSAAGSGSATVTSAPAGTDGAPLDAESTPPAATGTDGAPLVIGSTSLEAAGGTVSGATLAAGTVGTPADAGSPAGGGASAERSSPLTGGAAVTDGTVATDSVPAGGAVGPDTADPDATAAAAPRLAEHGGTGTDRQVPDNVVRGADASSTTPRVEAAARAEAAASSSAPPPPPALSSQLAASLARLRAAPDGQHVLHVRIDPDDLGPVRVTAHIGTDGVRIELVGMTEGARDALRGALADLRRELAATGFAADLDLGSEDGPSQHHPSERPVDSRSSEPEPTAPAPVHHAASAGGHGLDLLA